VAVGDGCHADGARKGTDFIHRTGVAAGIHRASPAATFPKTFLGRRVPFGHTAQHDPAIPAVHNRPGLPRRSDRGFGTAIPI
jgi:hypothetical protein